jgi:AcrR family transcriptional regulator
MERLKTKDALILAGIQEIRQFGLQNFSIRRIAAECGVSCATPYKHYPNKDMFILAIFRYLGNEWHKIQSEIIERRLSIKETIVEISVAYVHFLVDNPDYRNIIFSHDDDSFTPEQSKEIYNLTSRSQELISKYCASVGMPADVRIRKTFVVRSIVYSAAIMIENGELDSSDETYNMIRKTIEREFELE